MAETVKVEPTPIQRNRFDVAMELTHLHCNRTSIKVDEIQSIFAKYYALAEYCEHSDIVELQKLLSDDLLQKVGSLKPYNPNF